MNPAGRTASFPKATVLMPVYNGETYIREAVLSILAQTFADFELLIINDGSTDRTREIVLSMSDPRINLVDNERNLGLIATLNRGIGLARGTYIARMDADDISLPSRLEKQIAYMEQNPETGICGSWVRTFGDPDATLWIYPEESESIRCALLFGTAMAHPSVIMRRDVLTGNGLFYSPEYPHAEDYELWVRAAGCTRLSNIGEYLLRYRLHPTKVGRVYSRDQRESCSKIRQRQIARLGLHPTPEEVSLHDDIGDWTFHGKKHLLKSYHEWLMKLRKANDASHVYEEPDFSRHLLEKWFSLCYHTDRLSIQSVRLFIRSPLLSSARLDRPFVKRFVSKRLRILLDRIMYKKTMGR